MDLRTSVLRAHLAVILAEISQLLTILIKSSLEHCTEILTVIASFFVDLRTSVLRAHLAVILAEIRKLLTTSTRVR